MQRTITGTYSNRLRSQIHRKKPQGKPMPGAMPLFVSGVNYRDTLNANKTLTLFVNYDN
jgi:hypothetical protein